MIESSPCKVNFSLNILGKRSDGFHELETLMVPVPIYDRISMEISDSGIQLHCSDESLPSGPDNLVFRAAELFFEKTGISSGIHIDLQKNIPIQGGLGGGSSNAARTLVGLNIIFGNPLTSDQLSENAAMLGSDVPFFIGEAPALAFGRGERIRPLDPFPVLKGLYMILIRPGFGISTPWAYRQSANFPNSIKGQPGKAQQLADSLRNTSDWKVMAPLFQNSLEAAVFHKYPILSLYKQFLIDQGSLAALMSGSGSTLFALLSDKDTAENLQKRFENRFGNHHWSAVVSF